VIRGALLKLQQACCDPRLPKLSGKSLGKAGSAKLKQLDEMPVELVAKGRRILVFSQFASMLDLIRPRLDTAGVGYALLTGDTRDRPTVIRRFQDGAVPVVSGKTSRRLMRAALCRSRSARRFRQRRGGWRCSSASCRSAPLSWGGRLC
jgi:hypothetical protein